MAPLLKETAKAHKRLENEISVTELELKSLLLKKKREGRAPRACRVELVLSSNLEKEESVKTRETVDQDQGECKDGESLPRKHKAHISTGVRLRNKKIPKQFSQNFFQDLCSIPVDQEGITQSERLTGQSFGKNMRMDCAGGTLMSTKKLERVLRNCKNGKRSTGSDDSGCFDSIAPGMSGKAGGIVVGDVLGHELSGGMAVLSDGYGSERGGCNVFDPVQADRWAVCDAKSLGLRMSLLPLKYESVQTAFVPKTHADAGLFLLLQAAELSREWQREIVVVQLDVKKASITWIIVLPSRQ